tara:strand:+ start:5993 stop:6721 length:729 start_codon:yes stop_codon:yes gene_type:complete
MLKPKKSLSQNFLKDKNICKKIIDVSLIKNRTVIEVGPGKGFLTDFIIDAKPKKLLLIEKDIELFKKLKLKYKYNKNITLFNQDILSFNFEQFDKINIISNLPYNITSKFIFYCIKNYKFINSMTLMIQKEVANKIDIKKSKVNKYNFLINLYTNYKKCFDVSKNVFKPIPKVDSSVLTFNFKKYKLDLNKTLKFVNIIFKNKRKKIKNNICSDLLIKTKIDVNKRVEELRYEELIKIYYLF